MSQLSDQVDVELKNDTEMSRLNFLKYLEYGKQLAIEAAGGAPGDTITQAQLDEALAKKEKEIAKAIFFDIDAVMGKAGAAAIEVEKVDEDEKLAAITTDGKNATEVLAEVTALINDVDAKHSLIIQERKRGFEAIKAKYL